MKLSSLLISIFFILLVNFESVAQGNKEEQLAIQYFSEEEYDKALPLLGKNFSTSAEDLFLYEYYYKSLIQLKEYRDAEKLASDVFKDHNGNISYLIDAGYAASKDGNEKKAEKYYEDAMDWLDDNTAKAPLLANAFMLRGKPEMAIQTYERARKLESNEELYALQLARIHKKEGNIEPMFEEYLLATVIEPERFESTQGEIQELAMEESNYELFKNILIKKIQSQPNEDLYVDFLSWLFIQNQDFKQALIQFKALDRRTGEGEIRLIQLASVAEEYNEYDIAEEVYDYIIAKGESSNFYYRARQGILDVRYYKVTRSAKADLVEIESLERDLEEFVDRNVFRFEGSGESVLRLAEIEAVYLNNPSEGIETLRSFLTRYGRRINESLEAEVKLALGDYFILMDDVWEATLYYGQVEKMFKDHPLGHEAKFRNARLSFYRGEFDWAQAQLKVLKGSTSELIANDALNLSIMIQDNYGLDTSEKPLLLFSRADFLAFKGNYSEANKTFDSLLNNYPDHTLTDEIYFSKAKMFSRKGEYDTALYFYQKVYTEHANDILADDALAAAAEIKLNKLDDEAGAVTLYGKILFEYPGSVFIPEAREKYRQLESYQDLDKEKSEISEEEKLYQNMN